ncbi:uncharacterized protein LOC120357494 [Solenopsis invicta]|uniref:uncharacterized protein LOC120357494 n=1 Tax=Solenopsis invicta TaxID=13686 RepID=UPI00193D32BC|nr:uncharacterized protein LOC120357494 [Solenopsis invicta]
MAKSVERSKNIQGPIRKDLWRAYTDLTAGLTAIMSRSGEDEEARQRREERAALAKARAKWEAEKRKMEAELGQLRVRVALLEKSSHTRATDIDGYTDAEVQTDMDLDAEVIDSLTGEPPHLPHPKYSDTATGESPGEAPYEAATTKRTLPVVVSVEKLKEPYFRPPLKGVSKQLNPLSKVADRRAAPAPRSSFPAFPPPSSPLEKSGWARVGESGRKEKKRAKALTEDGLKEALSRVLPAVLAEMGLLPAPRMAERPRAPPTADKIAKQSGVAPQKEEGNAAVAAARPAPRQEATPSILELWTEVVSKKTKKKAAKAAERATKTVPPLVARPTRVLSRPRKTPPNSLLPLRRRRRRKGVDVEGDRGDLGGKPQEEPALRVRPR